MFGTSGKSCDCAKIAIYPHILRLASGNSHIWGCCFQRQQGVRLFSRLAVKKHQMTNVVARFPAPLVPSVIRSPLFCVPFLAPRANPEFCQSTSPHHCKSGNTKPSQPSGRGGRFRQQPRAELRWWAEWATLGSDDYVWTWLSIGDRYREKRGWSGEDSTTHPNGYQEGVQS